MWFSGRSLRIILHDALADMLCPQRQPHEGSSGTCSMTLTIMWRRVDKSTLDIHFLFSKKKKFKFKKEKEKRKGDTN